MNDQPCHEIVEFSFLPGHSLDQQTAWLRVLGEWAAACPGFGSRQCYHDALRGRWIDHICWNSRTSATQAMERAGQEPALADIFSALDQRTVSLGHYVRLI